MPGIEDIKKVDSQNLLPKCLPFACIVATCCSRAVQAACGGRCGGGGRGRRAAVGGSMPLRGTQYRCGGA